MKPILFVADLHLSDSTPDLNALFLQFLHDKTNQVAALYLLGDIFDAWTGDDDDSQIAAQVARSLSLFAQTAPVYFIAGNRDFLLGNDYAKRAGITLLPENYSVEYFGQKLLLTHGDEMCTQDISYLRYRRIIRHSWVKKILLRLPFYKRKQIAEKLRNASHAKKQQSQNYEISDVTEDGVQAALTQFPNTQIIIHGHTHRPNCHTHDFQNRSVLRYVLPDWHNGIGGFLQLDEQGIHVFRLPENPL